MFLFFIFFTFQLILIIHVSLDAHDLHCNCFDWDLHRVMTLLSSSVKHSLTTQAHTNPTLLWIGVFMSSRPPRFSLIALSSFMPLASVTPEYRWAIWRGCPMYMPLVHSFAKPGKAWQGPCQVSPCHWLLMPPQVPVGRAGLDWAHEFSRMGLLLSLLDSVSGSFHLWL